jgi:hypothetical protein
MKKYAILLVTAVIFTTCSNPVLNWIDTPGNTFNSVASVSAGAPVSVQPVSDKAITAFSFGISGEEISIRGEMDASGTIPIKAVLPLNSNRAALGPAITYIGASMVLPDGTTQTARSYTDSLRSFESSQVYTVKAGDGSEQKYTVEVSVKTAQSAEIVWFDLELGGVKAEGVVNQPSGSADGEITLHVPPGTSLTNLTAKVAQTGKSISDNQSHSASSIAATLNNVNFSNPAVPYTATVMAEDGGTKDYVVTVIVDKSPVKEITVFSFDGYENNETVIIGAEAQLNGKYPIVVTVPVSASTGALKPVITYKGAEIGGPGILNTRTTGFDTPFSVTGNSTQDFSAPVTYRVKAEDGSYRDYEVTVYKSDLNTGKAITGFYFLLEGTQGSAGIINETAHTIAVTVPAGTNLNGLQPTIYHTGASISPLSGAPRDFRNPVVYTVTARDGSTQAYTVTVFAQKKSDKAITAFDFSDVSGETTVIGGTPVDGKIPIVVTVPYYNAGVPTNLAALTPVVTHTGDSISGWGIPNQAGGPAVVAGSSPADFTVPRTYTVKAEDDSTQPYSVTVVKTANPAPLVLSADASIDGFYFNNPNAVGVIDQGNQTIAVTVPFGTDVENLIPTIYFTGNVVVEGATPDTTNAPTSTVIGGTTVYKPYMSSPAGFEATDFTHSTNLDSTVPVKYTVTALDQATSKTYTVTVSADPPPPQSSVRVITFFTFYEVTESETITTVSAVPDASGKYPVEVIVPEGTNLAALTPVILYKGVSISGAGEDLPNGTPAPYDPEILGTIAGTPVDFSNSNNVPIIYTVRAANGASSQYAVKVREDDNNKKEITAFYFTSPAAVGIIDQQAKIITVSVPNGTNLSALSPTVSYTGVSLDPPSGRAVNFSSPVTYTVSARNGTSQPYMVRVIPKPASTKEIIVVSLPGAGVLETVIGAVPNSDGFIPVSITVSEQTDISALRPTITHTGVSITPPGGTPQTANPFIDSVRHFGSPQAYRVTAEDGSFKDYAVSVHVSGGGAKIITGFVFNSVPLGSGTVTAVGQINQDTHTIEVRVPHNADISGVLAPTISYLGKSAAYTGTGPGGTPVDTDTAPAGQKGNTYTDTARNFESSETIPRYYTITAQDPPPDNKQEYTVKVIKIPEVTISYESPRDDRFTTESFNQTNGLLTVIIDTSSFFPVSAPVYQYTSPYDWYVDSVKQNVSTTQNTLVIKTADFSPGRHQVTVSATRGSDGKHYTNVLYFVVQE